MTSTRISYLWRAMESRCKVGGIVQRSHPTYTGTTNGFKDFEEFSTWCTSQYGFSNKDANGRLWQLDKDLKVFGNKVYSPETCIFVPAKVNCVLLTQATKERKLPIGASTKKEVFESFCSIGLGRSKYLGRFSSSLEAHAAWQKCKIDYLRTLCIEDEEICNHKELVVALLKQAQRIEADLFSKRETK